MPRPADHLHPQLGRHVIQHLRTAFADNVHRAAATGTRSVLDIEDRPNPGQVRGQRAAVALRLGTRRVGSGPRFWFRWFLEGRRGIEPGLLFGDELFKVLHPLLQLLIVELFQPAAKLMLIRDNQGENPRQSGRESRFGAGSAGRAKPDRRCQPRND